MCDAGFFVLVNLLKEIICKFDFGYYIACTLMVKVLFKKFWKWITYTLFSIVENLVSESPNNCTNVLSKAGLS